ncbi:AraC family transcriptional regulator [uncultured Cyclobacterium sp.]|uniref:AraC family transcriptional regulator n=1 Tax=uncultured Cyclobacterium sp. TaxID=453820 RepID=UPI0030ECF7AE
MLTIPITNMVCPRCVMAVEDVISDLGLSAEVKLGSAVFQHELKPRQFQQFEKELYRLGFSIAKSREMVWVETVKFTLIQLFEKEPSALNAPISPLLTEKVGIDYSRLSQLFHNSQGKTIAQYFIELKIEKAKEWLSFEEVNISQTAWKLGYASVQYFSAQFKKITGLTPSEFKKSAEKPRKYLDSITGKN